MSEHVPGLYSYNLRWPNFRLLRLYSGQPYTPLRCQLYTASPGECYEAVSYVWGNNEAVELIQVNDQYLWITDNLFDVLQHIRHAAEDRILWIDGICIDQTNLDEKSNQVQNMSSIYARADRVLVWLGKPTLEISILMDLLTQLQEEVEFRPIESRDAQLVQQLWGADSASQAISFGLRTLLNRPWFFRIWTLQEIANAQSALICSGIYAVDAYIFVAASSLIDSSRSKDRPIMELMPAVHCPAIPRVQENIFICLRKFKDSQASNQRDMIYALLNLSSSSFDRESIIVDYNKPCGEVFEDAMHHVLRSHIASTSQVLDFLADFDGLSTLYITFSEEVPWSTSERLAELKAEALRCYIREDVHEDVPSMLCICRSEDERLLSELETIIQTNRGRDRWSKGLDWRPDRSNVRVSAVGGVRTFLEFVVEHDLRIIAERFVKVRPTLFAHRPLSRLGELLPNIENALFTAIVKNRSSIVRVLLAAGADPNACKYHSGMARRTLFDWGSFMLDFALRFYLDPAPDAAPSTLEWDSPRMRPPKPEPRSMKIFNMLLDAGGESRNSSGKGQVLDLAAQSGSGHLVRLLLERGIAIDQQACSFNKALTVAIYEGNLQKVLQILESGAKIDDFMHTLAIGEAAPKVEQILRSYEAQDGRTILSNDESTDEEDDLEDDCLRCRAEIEVPQSFHRLAFILGIHLPHDLEEELGFQCHLKKQQRPLVRRSSSIGIASSSFPEPNWLRLRLAEDYATWSFLGRWYSDESSVSLMNFDRPFSRSSSRSRDLAESTSTEHGNETS